MTSLMSCDSLISLLCGGGALCAKAVLCFKFN